jgi:uncharacterized protein YacL
MESTIFVILRALHNLNRWVIVILAVWVLYRAYSGWFGKKSWTDMDRKVGMFFGIAIDIQLLLGLILAFRLPPFPMGVTAWGTYLYEHIIPMVIVVVLAHLGSVFSRKAANDTAKHRTAALWYTAAVLLMLVAIPWATRPLFPVLNFQ